MGDSAEPISAFYSRSQRVDECRRFFALGFCLFMLNCDMGAKNLGITAANSDDKERMQEIIGFTAKTMATSRPVPFGALIVETRTGKVLQRAVNAVAVENDPSSH